MGRYCIGLQMSLLCTCYDIHGYGEFSVVMELGCMDSVHSHKFSLTLTCAKEYHNFSVKNRKMFHRICHTLLLLFSKIKTIVYSVLKEMPHRNSPFHELQVENEYPHEPRDRSE